MYALAMAEEVHGGGRVTPVAENGQYAPPADLGESEPEEPVEQVGLSAVRELALALGLADSGDPIMWEPA